MRIEIDVKQELSIPLRMKPVCTARRTWMLSIMLSIPLRMKRGFRWYPCLVDRGSFQFPWGWNFTFTDHNETRKSLSIPLRMKLDWRIGGYYNKLLDFQFPWGWNLRLEKCQKISKNLSIPLRMKHIIELRDMDDSTNFQFPWGWNETMGYRAAILALRFFQFPWGWNS